MPRARAISRAVPSSGVLAVTEEKKTPRTRAKSKVIIIDGTKSRPRASRAKTTEPSKSKAVPPVVQKTKRAAKKTVVSEPEALPALPIIKNELQLALLTPFRFPVDQSRLAAQVARLSGVAIVFIGALFALINLSTVLGASLSPSAILQQANTILTGTTTTTDNPPPSNIVPAPEVSINVSAPQPLTGEVYINVAVPYAEAVTISAYNRDTQTNVTIGGANKIDDLQWKARWKTFEYPDGTYRLIATIKNQYGTYTRESVNLFTVDNLVDQTQPNDPLGTDSSTSGSGSTPTTTTTTSTSGNQAPATTTTTQTTTTTSDSNDIELDVAEEGIIASPIKLIITGTNFKRVKLTARNNTTGVTTIIGYAAFQGEDTWHFYWDITKVTSAPYRLRAFGETMTGSVESSDTVEIDVYNETETSTTGTAPVTTTETETNSIAESEPVLEPEIKIRFPYSGSVSGIADVTIEVAEARFVEVYARQQKSLTPRFLGLAKKIDTNKWLYRWNTVDTPNGDYFLYARVGTAYGSTNSELVTTAIRNEIKVPTTEVQESNITEIKQVFTALEPVVAPLASTTANIMSLEDKLKELSLIEEDLQENIEENFVTYNTRLQEALAELARAIRSNDLEAIDRAEARIAEIKKTALENVSLREDRQYALPDLEKYVEEITLAQKARIERNEVVIKERLAQRALVDSDRDSVSDFDEVNLYETDPYQADSDGDGIDDGTEILGGFNPRSTEQEALIVFESPKQFGTEREDILKVDIVATFETNDAPAAVPQAVISGKGLPNSFVTLYIFSTPIVITVRTDENGSWSYLFDKELEDGEHEVFVAMTDNSGKIVAKSSPFPFVKTAEAFTPVDAAGTVIAPITESEPALINPRLLIVIASMALVALGLVLIMIGIHVQRQPKLEIVTP